jgi:tripartite-type tricarboxylate transporter receptor subunit TctC
MRNHMKCPTRRCLLGLAAGAAALPAVSRMASAQTYPARPVRVVVALPAGIAPDIIARLVGQGLSERLGQPFIIENRPGAGTNIGTEAVVRAPADGYTLLLVTVESAINASLYDTLNYNFIRDIAPVASITRAPFVMVVNPSFPAKTVPEFIAYAKAHPGKINMASAGNGTANHVFGEQFKMMAGVDLVHVPYRSSYMPDLLGGQVQVIFTAIATVIEYVRDGKLRALAVTTATRSDALPGIPTMSEFVPGYEASAWNGVGVPAGTSAEIIERLNKEINAVVTALSFKVRGSELGVEPLSMTSVQFAKFIAAETQKWSDVVKLGGIKLD